MHQHWCIPTVSAEFVARMEDLLELYAEPYDPHRPVVCFDERPCQLIQETCPVVPCAPGRPTRVDYEYRRAGTCNVFMLFEPLVGWRRVKTTRRRTACDVARCFKELVDIHYPHADRIRVVLDNLNVHTLAALYTAYPPAEARRIARRLEFHFTPKHGSWLNMAEIELSVLSRQCLTQRIPTIWHMRRNVGHWQRARNAERATVTWRFTARDARKKLKRLYPSTS